MLYTLPPSSPPAIVERLALTQPIHEIRNTMLEPEFSISGKSNEKVKEAKSLAILSMVDLAQTQTFLHTNYNHMEPVFEQNPFLGKHPSFIRLLVSSAAMNIGFSYVKSPMLRKMIVRFETMNVMRNFQLLEEWQLGR